MAILFEDVGIRFGSQIREQGSFEFVSRAGFSSGSVSSGVSHRAPLRHLLYHLNYGSGRSTGPTAVLDRQPFRFDGTKSPIMVFLYSTFRDDS